MPIAKKSFYHGAALEVITQDPHFTSINKVSYLPSSSAYQLNHDTGIYIKYDAHEQESSWHFTFSPSHQDEIRKLFDIYQDKTFAVFVCGEVGICIVAYGILASCLDFNHSDNEWIKVYRLPNGSFRIQGAEGEYEKTIPISAFPRVLFE